MKIVYFLMLMFVLFPLVGRADAVSTYSGLCIYPGGVFKIDLSGVFPKNDNYRVAVKNGHSRTEFYESVKEGAPVLIPDSLGRFPPAKLNYVKVNAISGSYLDINFEIYDDIGSLFSTINSGRICNLAWFREKHGSFDRYFRENEPPEIDEAVLFFKSEEKEKNIKAATFCLICFTLGGFMGFRTPKMIEY